MMRSLFSHYKRIISYDFNIVANMLVVFIVRLKKDGQVGGLIPHLVEGGVSIPIC
jgi:hypothetical protein